MAFNLSTETVFKREEPGLRSTLTGFLKDGSKDIDEVSPVIFILVATGKRVCW